MAKPRDFLDLHNSDGPSGHVGSRLFSGFTGISGLLQASAAF